MTPPKKQSHDELWVWLDDPAFGPRQHIGALARGERGSIRFTYDPEWLKVEGAFNIDPHLTLSRGDFYPGGSNFGVFLDSCPDRWGQVLMQRREVAEAKEEGRRPRDLGPWEFLKGVQDLTRMGALRFSEPGSEQFIAAEARSAPPMTSLAELQAVAFNLSRDDINDLPALRQWLKVLVAPGSSLGGARPKANLREGDGSLWIAKFPAAGDRHDVALWEKLVHDLAREAKIDVPDSRIWRAPGRQHCFLVQRFDREKGGRRFFSSAMTLLGRRDGEEASYLELAEFIASRGAPESLQADLKELFRRVVFNVATGNRDDHLRNHGFLRGPGGWSLAPAYDMNPAFGKTEHILALDTRQHLPDLALVLETAPFYRLGAKEARSMVAEVTGIVASWRQRGRAMGVSRADLELAEGLFLPATRV